MKFKTKEDLIIKDTSKDSLEFQYNYGYNLGISDAFKSFAERVEFYEKYSSNEEMLSKEEPKTWSLYPNRDNTPYDAISLRDYNNWLFDHCFKDVIKNVR